VHPQALRHRDRLAYQVRALSGCHRTAAVAAAGFLASSLIVVAGGRAGTVRVTIPLTSWFGC